MNPPYRITTDGKKFRVEKRVGLTKKRWRPVMIHHSSPRGDGDDWEEQRSYGTKRAAQFWIDQQAEPVWKPV